VDEVAAAIRPAVQEESESKLARFDQVVAGQSVSGGGFGPFGGPGIKPIKPFAEVRTRSIREQLAGTSKGMMLGFGGVGFPLGQQPAGTPRGIVLRGFGVPGGGPGGPPRGPGGPGGPDGFGPGMFLGDVFMRALDQDGDSFVTRDEFTQGFAKWFEAWNSDKSGVLTEEQLRAGINQDLSPFRGGPPPGFGSPPDLGPPGGFDDE
jgi:hypothetical protein